MNFCKSFVGKKQRQFFALSFSLSQTCYLSTMSSSPPSSPSCVPAALRARYAAAGQSHVFAHVDAGRVSASAASSLVAQLSAVDEVLVGELYAATVAAEASGAACAGELLPPPGVVRARGHAQPL